jgi:hypothetical protein
MWWCNKRSDGRDICSHFTASRVGVAGLLGTGQRVHSSPCNRPRKPTGGVEVQLYSFFNFGARWGWVVNAKPRPLYPGKRGPVNTVPEAGWAAALVWTGAENPAPTEIRFPDSPARTYTEYAIPIHTTGTTSMETMREERGGSKCLCMRIDWVLIEKPGEKFWILRRKWLLKTSYDGSKMWNTWVYPQRIWSKRQRATAITIFFYSLGILYEVKTKKSALCTEIFCPFVT